MKWPKLKRDRAGMRCRLLREIRTSVAIIPTGPVGVVSLWGQGSYANISFDRCSCRGGAPRVSRLDWSDIEPLVGEG